MEHPDEERTSNELVHDLLGLDTEAKPCEPRCDKEYCAPCAMEECPHNEPLHRHHDGCPACCAPKLDSHSRIESMIKRYWPKLLEVYISPLSQPGEITGWQVELKLTPNHFMPIGRPGVEISFHGPTVDDALRQAEEFMDP